jgi:hypothetical protein
MAEPERKYGRFPTFSSRILAGSLVLDPKTSTEFHCALRGTVPGSNLGS